MFDKISFFLGFEDFFNFKLLEKFIVSRFLLFLETLLSQSPKMFANYCTKQHVVK